MRDDPLRDCPSCGEPQLKRLISGGAGVIFKGQGFYVTDSRSGSSTTGPARKGRDDAGADTSTPESTTAKSSAKEKAGSSTGESDGKKPNGTAKKSA